ncbi:MAG: PIN domain-containing protein [Candidatus Woesearchaeota archaeon]
MKQIILDTNFLMIPAQFGVDIFTEIARIMTENYEIVVLDQTLKELGVVVASGKGRDSQAAKIALDLVAAKRVRVVETKENYVDKAILDLVEQDRHIVATQDRDLKKSLRLRGIPIIIMRKKQSLVLL